MAVFEHHTIHLMSCSQILISVGERKEKDINSRLLGIFYNKLQIIVAVKQPEDTFASTFLLNLCLLGIKESVINMI